MLARHAAHRLEDTAEPGHRVLMFVTPVREARHDKGRWASKPTMGPIDRGTVSRAWHKEALQDAGLRDMPPASVCLLSQRASTSTWRMFC
jgi:hypothetical protein